MRIPHIFQENTRIAFYPSPESLRLVCEQNRKLIPEDFTWDKDHCPTLPDFCIESLSKYFEKEKLLKEISCPDRDYLLEILSTKLPLEVAIPLIDFEHYWKRRYIDDFGIIVRRKKPVGWTWKSLYIERYVQYRLEIAEPEYQDEVTMTDILTLCKPYVKKLIATQLLTWKPPRNWQPNEIPEVWPVDHIDFKPIFKTLQLITEVDLIYGRNGVGEDFTWHMFKLSPEDCRRLGLAVSLLPLLKILRIHRSRLEYKHAQALSKGLVRNKTIEELDLSHCKIDDDGALCLAKVIMMHRSLRRLNLCDNQIGGKGGEGIGYAIRQEKSCPLEALDMRLNPLGHQGVLGVMRGVVRVPRPQELNLSGTLMENQTTFIVGFMVKIAEGLKKLDVSNNWFEEDAAQALITGLERNTIIEYIDIRETNISPENTRKIQKLLKRNRNEEIEETIDEEESEEVSEKELQVVEEVEEEEEEEEEEEGVVRRENKAPAEPKEPVEE